MATIDVKDAAGSTVALEKPLTPGTAADSASRPVAFSTEGKAQLGSLTETAPASDTASSGLNGRLQRIAQRLTSMIALLPTALGANGGLKIEGVASGTVVPVTGTITAVTAISNALPAGTNNIGDIDVLTVNGVAPAFGAGASGATVQRVVVASDQLASSITTQGAFAAGAQQVSLPSDHPTIGVTPAGNVAHDAADSGNPVKQGFKATTSLAGLTLVANADRTDGFGGVDGVQIVRPHCNLEDIVSGLLANTDGASTSVIAAQGAGIKVYITSVIIANSSATAVTVDLRDGAAGSVKATFPVPASTSGVVCNLPVPLGFTANTAVCMDGSAAASTVTCTLIGFKSKV